MTAVHSKPPLERKKQQQQTLTTVTGSVSNTTSHLKSTCNITYNVNPETLMSHKNHSV